MATALVLVHARFRAAGADAGVALAPKGASAGDAGAPFELRSWLDRLVASDAGEREAALAAMDRASPSMVAAIAEQLASRQRIVDRTAMSAVVARVVKPRPAPRDEIAGRLADGGFQRADDWFVLVMGAPEPGDSGWRDLASVLGLARCLSRIGTTGAARELAAMFAAYGDVLRPDLERQLVLMGDRAVPALIEMRRAEGKESRLFALKLLEALGKAIPGEAVQTGGDDQLLIEVLRAYGRAREIDAERVLLSFANSDRRAIREAAREAVRDLGEAGLPALRESYENLMSKKAPEGLGAEATARELFTELDKMRLSEAYTLTDEGVAALAQKDVERAVRAFDRALARDPASPRRAEMAPAYLAHARSQKLQDRPRTMAALRQVMRLDPGGALAREAEAELLVLEARTRAEHGVLDDHSLRRALELDPGNADAREDLRRIEAESEARGGRFAWFLYGAVALVLVVIGGALRFVHGRRSAR